MNVVWRVHDFLHWLGSWLIFLLTGLFSPTGRNVVCWIGAVCLGTNTLIIAWRVQGHITCDFAGQWLMGRMFYLKKAEDLYLSPPQKEIFAEGYKVGDADIRKKIGEVKDEKVREELEKKLDEGYVKMVQDILEKNSDKHVVEGPLYPPPAGLIFWPFAAMPPQPAHAVLVFVYALFGVLNGWFISRITRHRVQWGEAVLLIFCFPNTYQCFLLCQNSMLSLTILCAGWYCLHRGWPFCAGLIWGMFAYKPVFAVSLILVPILLPNWRMLSGMILGGLLFCVATLPFVGTTGLSRFIYHQVPVVRVEKEEEAKKRQEAAQKRAEGKIEAEEAAQMNPWERWLVVGKNSAEIYSRDPNWVWMSRDLVGLPRRRMWDPEGCYQTWRYAYERYVEGRELWATAWWDLQDQLNKNLEAKQREFSEEWPEEKKQAWREEFQKYREDQLKLRDDLYEKWQNEKSQDWSDHQQKVYSGEEWKDAAELATLAGMLLLLGFLFLTALLTGISAIVPWRDGLPPLPQAVGCRSAFLLLGGIMSCWHFMHYDLLLFALPVCLLLADLTRRPWPRFPGLVIALATLALAQGTLFYLMPNQWWIPASLALQMVFGLVGLVLLMMLRRWSWLLLVVIVLVILVMEILAGVRLHFFHYPSGQEEPALKLCVTVLPVLVLIFLMGCRLRLLLVTALLLLCSWDMYYSNGICRFPFETLLILLLWGMAGYWTLQEMQARSRGEGIFFVPATT